MINSKDDYKLYMRMDAQALGMNEHKKIVLWGNEIWRFERSLRHFEYHLNVTHNFVFTLFWKIVNRKLSYRLGFVIPPNTFGDGLRINHLGNIVVNPEAVIGCWCDIHQGVNIGAGYDGCPEIGNNVWIGPGVKIFGKIQIADECAIGANAVVNKSFLEKKISIAGVPARKISERGNIYIRELKK